MHKNFTLKSSIFSGGIFSDLRTFEFNHFHPHFGQYIWAFFGKIGFVEMKFSFICHHRLILKIIFI